MFQAKIRSTKIDSVDQRELENNCLVLVNSSFLQISNHSSLPLKNYLYNLVQFQGYVFTCVSKYIYVLQKLKKYVYLVDTSLHFTSLKHVCLKVQIFSTKAIRLFNNTYLFCSPSLACLNVWCSSVNCMHIVVQQVSRTVSHRKANGLHGTTTCPFLLAPSAGSHHSAVCLCDLTILPLLTSVESLGRIVSKLRQGGGGRPVSPIDSAVPSLAQ